MAFDTIYIVYGVIFLAALLLVEGLYYLFADGRGGREAVNRRMKMLESGATTREVFETLRREPKDKVSFLGPFSSWGARLDHLIQQTGMTLSIQRLLLMMAALTIACFLTAVLFTRGGLFSGSIVLIGVITVVSLGAGIGGPIAFLYYKKAGRLKTFAEQLPDALDIMVRSLQAGHPISAAMTLVTKEMPDPIGTEFGIAIWANGSTWRITSTSSCRSTSSTRPAVTWPRCFTVFRPSFARASACSRRSRRFPRRAACRPRSWRYYLLASRP
jgi:tight adherence protein B